MKEFWIKNISKQNVSLRDLGFTAKAGCSYNLLDSKHFNLTIEQIIQSFDSGSLFKKQDKIILRNIPQIKKLISNLDFSQNPSIRRQRSLIIVSENDATILPDFDQEQAISDQKFAEEFSTD